VNGNSSEQVCILSIALSTAGIIIVSILNQGSVEMRWLNCITVFVYIALVVQLICVLSYRPKRYHSQRLQLPFRIHRSHGEDVSPLRDNGIIKTILTPGDKAKGSPAYGDIVTICLERFDMNGNLIALPDTESMDDYKVTFGIGQDANIFLGIHYGVLSMYVGEVARLDISSAFAVPTIPKNISCRVTLLSVQSVAQLEDDKRLPLTDNDNEVLSGKDSEVYQDFKSKIEENGGDNPLATEVFNMRHESRDQKVPKYYDPSLHKLDPNRDLSGSGIDHTWYETVDTMEVYVPLPSVITSKNEISVVIK
jgi:hypothetical protein